MPERGYLPVMVQDCEGMFGQGTVQARECRQREQKRLDSDCAAARQREAAASSPSQLETQQMLVRSICREAERLSALP